MNFDQFGRIWTPPFGKFGFLSNNFEKFEKFAKFGGFLGFLEIDRTQPRLPALLAIPPRRGRQLFNLARSFHRAPALNPPKGLRVPRLLPKDV